MKEQRLDCPYDFTSRCTMGRCDCKPKEEIMYSEEEVVGLLYRRSIYQNHFESDSEIRLWFEQFKKK